MRYSLAALLVVGLLAQPVSAKPLLKKTPADKAVDKALEFLANTQSKSEGFWTGGWQGKHVAATSLAVMAFLSAGHVPGEGKYGKAIERGVRWVLTMQKPNGLIANDNGGNQEMYHHGIATLMLAEVAGMVDKDLGKEVRKAVEKAVALILKAQRTQGDDRGGWRYRAAGNDTDISVTGWQVMALRAAKNLGCDIPAEHITRAVEYVKRCQDPRSGGFYYGARFRHVTVPCTGTSILALELCGKDEHLSDAVVKGAGFLVRNENLPRWGQGFFFYGIYYGAQASFQVGGNYWKTYRAHLHRLMLTHQGTTGSWQGGGESTYGPNYSTAMAVLALTVEYRYLPIYQRAEEPQDKK